MIEHSHQKDLFAFDDLKDLAGWNNKPCVSIYLPTYKTKDKRKQNQTIFENSIKTADAYLKNLGTNKYLAESMLGPAMELQKDEFYWKNLGEGLVVFLAPGKFNVWRLPYQFQTSVTASDSFHLRPLLPFLSDDGKYFLLCVDKKQARLYEASRYGMINIDLSGLPLGISEIMPTKDFGRQIQLHSGGSPRDGEMFHGHGGLSEAQKTLLNRYFRNIDLVIRQVLMFEKSPLIFAGDEFLFPIYRGVNNYGRLLKLGVFGNPFTKDEESLHQESWRIAHDHFLVPKKIAFARYRELKNTGLTSSVPEVVVASASAGKVDTLLCADDAQLWGRYDPSTGSYEEHPRQEPGDVDLLGRAALDTFLHRGSVYFVSREEMPGHSLVSAILRH